MNYKERCADCIALIQKNGEWCCDECFGQKCEEIDECPEGLTEEEMAQIKVLEKMKINHGASAENKPTKEKKPKEIKVSDEKVRIFNTILDILDEKYTINVLKENKLIEIELNGKKFKVDLIETRAKKSS